MSRTLNPPQAEALMVAESCGRVSAERSEAQHTPTLAADSKTGAYYCSSAWLLLIKPRLVEPRVIA